jgi:WD40 repeat protein
VIHLHAKSLVLAYIYNKRIFKGMKILKPHILFIFIVLANSIAAQSLKFSPTEKYTSQNTIFEIIGKLDNKFFVYKTNSQTHKLNIYDNNLETVEVVKLDFVSNKTDNIDFIKLADKILFIWQYDKGSNIFCKGAYVDSKGKLIGSVFDLDSTRVGFLGNKVFYKTTWSEDRSKILVSKTSNRGDSYLMLTKVYDSTCKLLDSTRHIFELKNRQSYTDLQLANNGNIYFAKLKENARPEFVNNIELFIKPLYEKEVKLVNMPLNDIIVDEPFLKIDNINKNVVLTSFAYSKNGNTHGLYTALYNGDSAKFVKTAEHVFVDTLFKKMSTKGSYKTAFNNFFVKNLILRKDGGFLMIAEDYSKFQRFNNNGLNNFDNRYFNPYGFGSVSDYYMFNNGFNGGFRNFNDARDFTYSYNDIIIMGFDKTLNATFSNIINKNTQDVETDNFLSFTNVNAGRELHFVFLQKDNNREVLSNHALQPNGSIVRYSTIKSGENGFNFMPRLARQTGAKQILVPCVQRNTLAFAKIEF